VKFNINKILSEWAYRVDDGQPDVSNPDHIENLREILYHFGLPHKFIVEYVHGLTEKRKPGQTWKTKTGFAGWKPGEPQAQYGMKSGKEAKAYVAGKLPDNQNDVDSKPKTTDKKVKNKELKTQIDTNAESITKALEPNDDTFNSAEHKKANIVNDHTYKSTSITTQSGKSYDLPITTETLQSFFPSDTNKFNTRYVEAMQRLLNTEHVSRDEPTITSFISGVGAGAINAQAAELLTLMSTSMDDDNFNKMMEVLELSADQTAKRGIIDKAWLQSVRGARNTIQTQVRETYGDSATVEFGGWDTKEDVENGIGLQNYKKDKGHSTDVYFRVKTDEGAKIHEVSLKKGLEVFLSSPSTSEYQKDAKANGISIDQKDDAGIFKNSQTTNSSNKLSTTNNETITNISSMAADEQALVDKISKLPPKPLKDNLLKGGKGNYILSQDLKKVVNYTNKLKEAGIEYPLDTETYNSSEHTAILKELKLTGGKGQRKLATYMAYAQMVNESKDGELNRESEGYKFIQKHIGIDKDPDTGRYPEGSARDFSRRTIELLAKSEMRKQTMDMIDEKFPLESLMSGEESMALSGFGLDKNTCEKIFGTSDYDQVQRNISVEYDSENDNYYLSYTVDIEGKSSSVKIAEVESRQRGWGYQGAPTYGLKMADEFKHRTLCAQGDKQYNTADSKAIKKYTNAFGSCENPSYGA